jgi:hypothetical protein
MEKTGKQSFLLGIILFVLGFIGVLSLMTMDFTLPEEVANTYAAQFSDIQIKLLLLINPTILLLISVLIGCLFYQKVGFRLPILEALIARKAPKKVAGGIYSGIIGGLITGFILMILIIISRKVIPAEFSLLDTQPLPALVRFLYGGITEEIMMRFGLMTFFVWALWKITKTTHKSIYIVGIILSTVLFAIGHFPYVLSIIPDPSWLIITYVLVGNSVGGVIFGWLYWKKGLESAIIAHAFAHLVMLIGTSI